MKAEEEGEANMKKSRYLKGQRIAPGRIRRGITLQAIVENHFNAFNAARLREAARLFAERMLGEEVTVGMSLSGALTPAGLGGSCIVPLIENGFVDWIVSTGANLYHDAHFALGMPIRKGSPFVDDTALKREGVIRIYDILFDYGVLLNTDAFFREILRGREFQRTMGTSTLHHLIGTYLLERERKLGLGGHSLLAAASRYGVPVFTPSPGDSSIGMNIAALNMEGAGPMVDVSADVSESAAIVYGAKKKGGKSAVFIAGGGSAEELPPPDGAPHTGDPGHKGEGSRLLPPDHGRPARHGGAVGRHAVGGRLLGEGCPRPASRFRGVLRRQHHLPSPHYRLRAFEGKEEEAEEALPETFPAAGGADEGSRKGEEKRHIALSRLEK